MDLAKDIKESDRQEIMNRNKNIVLIGMPGVGKSTLGVILAKILGYEFVDSDLVIQKETGKLLREIIEEKGTDGFIKVEEEINCGLNVERSVIATGGSIVYGDKAMKHLAENGIILYLELDLETLESRLNNIKNRGVAVREGQTLKDLYEERCVLYEKYADITISERGLDIEQAIEAAEKAINDYLK